MVYLRIFIVFFIFVTGASVVSAGTNLAPLQLSFSDSLKIANGKNPGIIMAAERVKQSFERLNQARAALFPQLSANVSETRQTRNLETFGFPSVGNASPVAGPFNVFDARLKLTRALFDLAMIRRLEAVSLGKEVSKAEEIKVKEDALAFVAVLYIEAKRAEEALSFSKAVLRFAREKYLLANTHLRIGTGSEMDLKNAKAALSNARFHWRMSKTQAVDRHLDLKAALGFSEKQEIRLADKNVLLSYSLPDRQMILRSSNAHPEVNLAKENLREDQAQETAEKAEYLPKVSGSADYGASADQPNNSKETYSYGLQIAWALFEGGERNARIAESQSRSREAQTHLDDLTNQIKIKAAEAKESLKNTRNLLRAKEDSLAVYCRQLDLIKHRLDSGTASRLELIDAEAQTANAEDEAEEAFAAYQTAEVNLAHSLGQMEKLMEDLVKK